MLDGEGNCRSHVSIFDNAKDQPETHGRKHVVWRGTLHLTAFGTVMVHPQCYSGTILQKRP